MNYEMLGNRIREYRKKMNWTQEQLSESAGISLSFLGHIERGSRKASIETIVSLCNAMKISPHYLLQDSLNNELVGIPETESPSDRKMLQEMYDSYKRHK